jgi:glutathione synthase/RimK-type ligase-like ATP-grasp enzyme
MSGARVAFATAAAHPDLTDDDRLAVTALRDRGIAVDPAVWSAPGIRWESYDAVVIRSCWDYHTRADEFRGWLDRVHAAGVGLWNAHAVATWNLDKRYLRDLEQGGVDVVPTEWLARGSAADLGEVLDRRGWGEVVVKPAISASAFETVRCTREEVGGDGARIAALLADRDLMVQPFLPEIPSAGEWSIVLIGGAFSHAVIKRPRPGDFRVQAEWGGDARIADPGPELVARARDIAARAPGAWLYARVDGVETAGGFRLLELEMLEPSLFLTHEPLAAERFAAALAESLAHVA